MRRSCSGPAAAGFASARPGAAIKTLALPAFLRQDWAMAAYRSLYQILNVSADAEPVVIEAAYRALMKKYHPDQGASGEQSEAAEINGAFAILRDPERRAQYDRREWQRQQEMLHAQHAPPITIIRRRIGLFGWTGWLVATALGIVIVVAIEGSGAFGIPPAKVNSAAAVLPEPQLLSQPATDGEWPLIPAHVAGVEAELAEIKAALAPPAEVVAPPAARPVASAPKPRAQREARRRAAPRAESDFLEREGYIY